MRQREGGEEGYCSNETLHSACRLRRKSKIADPYLAVYLVLVEITDCSQGVDLEHDNVARGLAGGLIHRRGVAFVQLLQDGVVGQAPAGPRHARRHRRRQRQHGGRVVGDASLGHGAGGGQRTVASRLQQGAEGGEEHHWSGGGGGDGGSGGQCGDGSGSGSCGGAACGGGRGASGGGDTARLLRRRRRCRGAGIRGGGALCSGGRSGASEQRR